MGYQDKRLLGERKRQEGKSAETLSCLVLSLKVSCMLIGDSDLIPAG